jgi:hypothetical protein
MTFTLKAFNNSLELVIGDSHRVFEKIKDLRLIINNLNQFFISLLPSTAIHIPQPYFEKPNMDNRTSIMALWRVKRAHGHELGNILIRWSFCSAYHIPHGYT